MPEFKYKGQLLDIAVMERLARRIVNPHLDIAFRRAIIRTVRDPLFFDQASQDFIEELVYIYAIGSCNVATKPRRSLIGLSTEISLVFAKLEDEYNS